ncbi:MAG: VOC family protein [Litorimonas sp.]
MEKVTGIGGLFFRAQDHEVLAIWYRTHLGIDLADGFWHQASGPTVFKPFKKETKYFPDDRGWMVDFRVDDLDAMTAQLEAAGIEVITKKSWNSEFGRYARIHDPDGNPIELWEPGPAAPTGH